MPIEIIFIKISENRDEMYLYFLFFIIVIYIYIYILIINLYYNILIYHKLMYICIFLI